MKFLLNMNLPRELGQSLAAEGHVCRHAGDIGMARSSAADIIMEARGNRETILTHDLDYGHLLAFSGVQTPSVIILRLRNAHPRNLLRRIMSAWSEIEDAAQTGAIVVIEDAATRIRLLPVDASK